MERTTILVVEDEFLVREFLADTLIDAGYQVVAVADADAAIKMLETRNDIRLVITDIDMPGSMDGLKLAVAVRDRWPPVHIIIATGMQRPRDEDMPSGSLFFPKPYDMARVMEAVRRFD